MASSTEEYFIRELTTHQSAIGAYLRSILPVQADIDSLAQEVNITLWKKSSTFKQGTNFKAWAFQVAKFHALNERRKLVREKKVVFDEEVIHRIAVVDVSATSETSEVRIAALDQCLARLSAKNRALIAARYTQGLTIESYAQSHGEKSSSLRVVLRRVRMKLKLCIEEFNIGI